MNNKNYIRNTDNNGVAYLKINLAKGFHLITYQFNESGFVFIKGSSKLLIILNSNSKISPIYTTVYTGIGESFKVTLSAGGVKLVNKKIRFTVKGKTYYATTNNKGVAQIKLKFKGKYTIKYYYSGEGIIKSYSGKSKINFQKQIPTKFKKANFKIYRQKIKTPFKVKLLDKRGKPLVAKKIKFKLGKKTYVRKTGKNGIATLNIKLKKGSYKLTCSFSKTSVYKNSKNSYKLKVRGSMSDNNGIWLLSSDMDDVNLNKFSKFHIKHIFLNSYALERHGKFKIESFIKNARNHGIKVHIWMQIFYEDGKWVSPVNKDGSYKYNFMNQKIKLAKKYATLKGVGGIHFDYLRFPGNAYKYLNGAKAINYFTKKCSNEIHKVNSKAIVSAAVMPEPSCMKKYYGQDIPTISKSLDVIIPMIYKGNYNQGTKWIKKVTTIFIKQSRHAKIWSGIQTYKSDAKATKLSSKSLLKDAKSAASGGARGVILFRYGLYNDINFNYI